VPLAYRAPSTGWPTDHKYSRLIYPKKCAVLHVGKNRISDHFLSIATNPMRHFDVAKDLDILVDESLSFSSHILCYSCIYQGELDS